jgi:hypothetical protein
LHWRRLSQSMPMHRGLRLALNCINSPVKKENYG